MGCFQSTIVNSAEKAWVCKWPYHILEYLLLDVSPGVVLLAHMVVLFLGFWETSILLSITIALIYIPTNSVEVFLFPISSPAFIVFCIIDDNHSDPLRWNLNVVLICISYMPKEVEHFFICFLAICISSFENCLFCSFATPFSGLLILCKVSFWAPCIFWLLIPCQMYSW
jgi:hypothetical protein